MRCHSWCAQDTRVKVGQYAASARIKAKSSRKSLFFCLISLEKEIPWLSFLDRCCIINLALFPKYEKQSGSISRPRHPLLIFIDNLMILLLLLFWWYYFIDNLMIRLKLSDQVYFARRPSGTFIRLWYEWRWYGALPPPHHGRPRQCFSTQDLHLNSQEGWSWGEANFPSERKTGEHCVRSKSPPCDDHQALRFKKKDQLASLWSWSLYKEWPLSCNVFHIALTIVSMSPRMWSNHWDDHWSYHWDVIISLIWQLIDRRDHHVILVLASCTIAPQTQTSISAKIAVINVIKSE